MPDASQRFGQCDSVTGNALLRDTDRGKVVQDGSSSPTNDHQSASSSAASALVIRPTPTNRPHHSLLDTYIPTNHTRLVPVSATARALDNSTDLPPSPPSTPSQSPPVTQVSSITRPNQDFSLQNEGELRSALYSMQHLNEDDEKFESMPNTPDATPLTISPVDDLALQHRPASSLRDFVTGVLPDLIPLGGIGAERRQIGRYVFEDAGMELVCPGWTGAVLIDTKPLQCFPSASTSSSSSPGTRQFRAPSELVHMSRASSATSSVNAAERLLPRRTLLTRMASHDLGGEALRTRILDVLDHATEQLHANNVIFVLDRFSISEERFCAIVHGLCYVGATIIGYGAVDGVASSSHLPRSQSTTPFLPNMEAEESIHAPRRVSRNLVLLSVDV